MVDVPGSSKTPSLLNSVIKGSVWMVLMRLSFKGLGLISTIILARLLMPEDFGIIAMAILLVELLDMFSTLGVDIALIRTQNPTRDHYDTAWTFKIIQGTFIAILLFVLASSVGDYFNEDRIVPVIHLLAVGVFILSFENIGVVNFRKEMQFSREFNFQVLKRLIRFSTSITLAFILMNYWALAISIVVAHIFGVILSYIMHSYRPRFSLKAASELWSFSQWILLLNVLNYINLRIDSIILGRLRDTDELGTYRVALDVATLPTTEVVAPLSSALVPGYAKLLQEKSRLRNAFLNAVSTIILLAAPAGAGMAILAEDLVLLLLGEKWELAIPLISWLAIYGGIYSVGTNVGQLLTIIGRLRSRVYLALINILFLVPILYEVAHAKGLVGVANAKVWLALPFLFAMLYLAKRELTFTWMNVIKSVWRPLVACVVMVFVIDILVIGDFETHLVSVIMGVCVGVVSYSVVLYILWLLSGKPSGAEAVLIKAVLEKVS